MVENYSELEKANILPTSKKETKYLLGISEKTVERKNWAEEGILRICADVKKGEDGQEPFNKRNIHALPEMISEPVAEKFEGDFEDLIKLYEQDTGRKVMVMKTKKDGPGGKSGLSRVRKYV